ncbi:MAG: hypothetical protein Q4F84_04165 [Fibrobacter sp.]|nr:hypothetical protein [Fibrobacter sp.]
MQNTLIKIRNAYFPSIYFVETCTSEIDEKGLEARTVNLREKVRIYYDSMPPETDAFTEQSFSNYGFNAVCVDYSKDGTKRDGNYLFGKPQYEFPDRNLDMQQTHISTRSILIGLGIIFLFMAFFARYKRFKGKKHD